MKNYITPNVTVVKLQANDLIMNSGEVGVANGNANPLTLDWGAIDNTL